MRRGWLVLAATAWLPLAIEADEAASRFTVSAEVMPRVTVESVALPATLAVTADDIARGYVDVGARFSVRSNDPRGFLLTFMPRTGLGGQVQVLGLGGAVTVGTLGAEVPQRRTAARQDYALEFRVLLDAADRPGEYAMPLAIGAATL